MSLYKDMAIAVCKQDFESIKEKHKEVIGDGYIRDISTPDENYTILYDETIGRNPVILW